MSRPAILKIRFGGLGCGNYSFRVAVEDFQPGTLSYVIQQSSNGEKIRDYRAYDNNLADLIALVVAGVTLLPPGGAISLTLPGWEIPRASGLTSTEFLALLPSAVRLAQSNARPHQT